MMDELARSVAAEGNDEGLRLILEEVCRVTAMGFAAIAHVTEDRWIAAQVLDKIEFGLRPGDELEIKTTICDEIRQSSRAVIIDHVADHPDWRTHPTPMLYGFESYVSMPVTLKDGSFYGTLCAIDPLPRQLSAPATIAAMEALAAQVAVLLSLRQIDAAALPKKC